MWVNLDQELVARLASLPADSEAIRQLQAELSERTDDFNSPLLEAYVEAARMKARTVESELDVDDDAVVSRGEDPGAFVMAWLWVDASEVEGD